MTEHARVAIVGGGAMGAGLAYHLAEEGWTDIVLLEKGELTSGSTWHAAGLCTYFIGGYAIAQLHAYGVKFYPRLEELTGRYVSWHGCGSMRLAPDRDFEDWYRHVGSLAGRIGFEVCFLSPSEVKKLHPYLSLEGVRAVAMTPGDGHVDPAGVANAMADGARRMGARIQVRRQVTGIHRERNGEWRLRTDKGDIVAEHVVNAAGCYARRLQAMVGGAAPIANMLHHYVVTEPIPELVEREGELPVVRDPHASNYLRQEQKAGMIGVYETAGAAEAWNGADPEWAGSHELFEPDYDRIGMWLGRGLERIPLFGSVGLKRAVHGAITHTPDANPLLGPAPGLDNFWRCTGSSIGIAQGAGAGKYLAQWMVHGDSEINMASVDPRRFGDWTTAGRVSAKSVQDYGHMYAAPLPGEELPAGRPARVSSLHDALIARGAVHTEAFGWERPKWFSVDGRVERHSFRRSNAHDLVAEECRAVRERVGVMDFSSFSKLQVSGSGAGGLLRRLYANRPPRPGRIALAPRLSAQASIAGESPIAGPPGGAFHGASGPAWIWIRRGSPAATSLAAVEGEASFIVRGIYPGGASNPLAWVACSSVSSSRTGSARAHLSGSDQARRAALDSPDACHRCEPPLRPLRTHGARHRRQPRPGAGDVARVRGSRRRCRRDQPEDRFVPLRRRGDRGDGPAGSRACLPRRALGPGRRTDRGSV